MEKEFNREEYNKLCAEFMYNGENPLWTSPDYANGLFWISQKWLSEARGFESPDGNDQFHPKDMKFDTDWNWIMEVVEKIQHLGIVHDNTRSYDSVFKEWRCTFSPSYKTHDFGYIVGSSKTSEKEAVVQAIWQFLNWYAMLIG